MVDRSIRRGRPPRRILLFAGTRPEAIKQAPLALAARGWDDVEVALVHSGQHGALFDDGLAPFGLTADHVLAVDSGVAAPAEMVERIGAALTPFLHGFAPDMVVVQGDTSSALAGAVAAHRLGIPLAHVEAGLRSGDPALPWPEEGNRIAIAQLADLNFAPSAGAARNLAAEAVPGRIHVVGNPGIDALLTVRERVRPSYGEAGRRQIAVTAHRREIIGAPLDRVATALKRIVAGRYDRHVSVFLHSNPAGRQLHAALHDVENVTLRSAVDYAGMVSILAGADLVLSDSGGLQEECPALGVPLIVLRTNTERPEVIEQGGATMVGTDVEAIVAATNRLLDDPEARAAMSIPRFPYGAGDAATRILDVIATFPFPPG